MEVPEQVMWGRHVIGQSEGQGHGASEGSLKELGVRFGVKRKGRGWRDRWSRL